MRAVLQRVREAEVRVGSDVVGSIGMGLCVLVGVAKTDVQKDAHWLAAKVSGARVFADGEGKMNCALGEIAGELLAVSQFTLLGDLRGGRRPSFGSAMTPAEARQLFDAFCAECARLGVSVQTGRFGATMQVHLVNDGPVTLLLDSKKLF